MSDLSKEAVKVIYYYNSIYGNIKQMGRYPERRKHLISKIYNNDREQYSLEGELFSIMMTILKND